MRAITLSGTSIDLLSTDYNVPIGATVTLNAGNGIIVQHSDDDSSFSTLATLTTAAPFQTVSGVKRYVKVSTSNPATLFVD